MRFPVAAHGAAVSVRTAPLRGPRNGNVAMVRRRPVAYLIDAPVYVFRAYYSLPDSLADPAGQPVNAVYGYGQFLCGLLERERPSHVAAAFDESLTSSFRNDWYAEYKANRASPPEELERQFGWCKRLTRAMGVRVYASGRFEADDLIATAASRLRGEGFRLVIVSRDKDLAQLVGPGDRWWDGLDGPRLDRKAIRERFGVLPAQIADYLALVGDAVDNIPGVPGVGPKAASALLARFGSLAGIYRHLHRVTALELRGAARLAERLAAHREQALLSLQLATLHTGARIRCDAAHLAWEGPRRAALTRLFRELGVGERLRERCFALAPKS